MSMMEALPAQEQQPIRRPDLRLVPGGLAVASEWDGTGDYFNSLSGMPRGHEVGTGEVDAAGMEIIKVEARGQIPFGD